MTTETEAAEKPQQEANTRRAYSDDENPNMEVWNNNWKTTKDVLREVQQRGGFFDINPMYLNLKMTREFGPVGKGWGWEHEPGSPRLVEIGGEQVWDMQIRIWWVKGESTERNSYTCGATHAAAPKGKFDEDAKKKCFTDALKKGLSYLGFAADVFLGMHDKGKRGGR